MTTVKTSALTSLTTPARNDVLLISDVSAGSSHKIAVRELVAQAYADVKLIAATATAALTTTDTKLTVFDGTTAFYNCSVAADTDSILVDSAGVYVIHFSVGGYLDSAKTVAFKLAVEGVADDDSQVITAIPIGVTNAVTASFCVLKNLVADDILTITASVHSGTATMTFNNLDLVVRKIDASA